MNSLNPVKVSDEAMVFEITSPSQITSENLHTFFQSNIKKWVIFRAPNIDENFLNEVALRLRKSFFVQVGFVAEKDQINPFGISSQLLTTVENGDSREVISLIKSTIVTDFLEKWSDYLGICKDEFAPDSINSLFNGQQTLTLYSGVRPVAVSYVFDHHDCLRKDLNQIGWVWINEHLSTQERSECHHHLTNWFKNRFSGFFQAGIHIENMSISFQFSPCFLLENSPFFSKIF